MKNTKIDSAKKMPIINRNLHDRRSYNGQVNLNDLICKSSASKD